MSSNYNNTFDGQDEPVRPTPGGRKRRLDKENHKKQLEKKVDQDRAILDLLDIMKVNRRRTKIKDVNKRKDRKISVKYSLLCGSHPEKVPVCKASFIKVL
ncbi:unnamed protein product, partial [Arctogadus glacialis]